MAKLYPIILHAKPYSTLPIQLITQITCLLLMKPIQQYPDKTHLYSPLSTIP